MTTRSLPPECREGVSGQRCSESDGHGISAQHEHPRRPRRSAKARRQQQLRAFTRMTVKLAEGLSSLQTHRGCALSSLGRMFAATLHVPAFSGGAYDGEQSFHNGTSYKNNGRDICRHFLQGRCSYGAACRFEHALPTRLTYNSSYDHHGGYHNGFGYNSDHDHDEDDDGEVSSPDERLSQASHNMHENELQTDGDNHLIQHTNDLRGVHHNTHDMYEQQHDDTKNVDDERCIQIQHDHTPRAHEHDADKYDEGDDIDGIIEVLRALDHHDAKHALHQLPIGLYQEVLARTAKHQTQHNAHNNEDHEDHALIITATNDNNGDVMQHDDAMEQHDDDDEDCNNDGHNNRAANDGHNHLDAHDDHGNNHKHSQQMSQSDDTCDAALCNDIKTKLQRLQQALAEFQHRSNGVDYDSQLTRSDGYDAKYNKHELDAISKFGYHIETQRYTATTRTYNNQGNQDAQQNDAHSEIERNGSGDRDGIDDIIGVITALPVAAMPGAFAALPHHLLTEVQNRLAQSSRSGARISYGDDLPYASTSKQAEFNGVLSKLDDISHKLVLQAETLLRLQNFNKKQARRVYGIEFNDILPKVILRRRPDKPNVIRHPVLCSKDKNGSEQLGSHSTTEVKDKFGQLLHTAAAHNACSPRSHEEVTSSDDVIFTGRASTQICAAMLNDVTSEKPICSFLQKARNKKRTKLEPNEC